MSAAYDLTATVSLPEVDDGAEAANDPGPTIASRWSPPTPCTGEGADACSPEGGTRDAPAPEPQWDCRQIGDTEAAEEAGPMLPSGEPYPGNLLADILEYRRMRARVLGGATLPEAQESRYGELQGLLCATESEGFGHSRAYHRFDIRVPALLRLAQGRGSRLIEVGVDNLSAGGVKLEGAEARTEGERVELLMNAGQDRVVVLPARIAWMRGTSLGLMFAGAARWQ